METLRDSHVGPDHHLTHYTVWRQHTYQGKFVVFVIRELDSQTGWGWWCCTGRWHCAVVGLGSFAHTVSDAQTVSKFHSRLFHNHWVPGPTGCPGNHNSKYPKSQGDPSQPIICQLDQLPPPRQQQVIIEWTQQSSTQERTIS